MIKINLLLSFALFLGIAPCTAAKQIERAPQSVENATLKTNSAEFQDQIKVLENIFRKRIFSLDRKLFTFRYEDGSTANFYPTSQQDVQQRIKVWPQRFFNSSIINGEMIGPGTYVAIDPVGSIGFGGSDPLLFVIPIKKGARLYNATKDFSIDDAVKISGINKKFSCIDGYSDSNYGSPNNVFYSFRNSKNQECRELIITAMKDLGISGILYNYTAENLNGCRNRGEAINVIDSSIIALDKINFYSPKQRIEVAPIVQYVSTLFMEATKNYDYRVSVDKDVVSAPNFLVTDKQPTADQYSRFKNNYIYKCGNPWAGEINDIDVNTLDDILLKNIQKNYIDKDIQNLIIKFARVYNKIALDPARNHSGSHISSFDVGKLNALEKIEFLSSGLPQDSVHFENWKKAHDLIGSDSDYSNTEQISNQLKENETTSEKKYDLVTYQLSNKYSEQDLNRASFPWSILSQIGAGPRYARIAINDMILYYGGIPLLKGPLPLSLDQDISGLISANKILFENILTKCLSVYSDPNISYQEIQNGECGIRRADNQ